MRFRFQIVVRFLSPVLFISCSAPVPKSDSKPANTGATESVFYAKRFNLVHEPGFTRVYIFGNRRNFDTTARYIVSKDTVELQSRFKNAMILQYPCKKIAALSSIYAAMLCELGVIENLAAIDNIDYVNEPAIIDKYKRGELKELARGPLIDLEQAIALRPDIIFTFGMGDGTGEQDQKLALSKLPVMVSVDHLEESPLARAEWIKCFAAFVNKGIVADSIFAQVEKNYLSIKKITDTLVHRPTVFSETKFGDVWYMPGGKSYMAQILHDAGASYLWKDNTEVGSLPLSFEQVYAKARDADFWINLPLVKNKKELIAYEDRYAEFKAYKTGRIYNNTKHKNEKGYSIYWETGMIHPDRILSDLSGIFHPALKPVLQEELFYYEQLK